MKPVKHYVSQILQELCENVFNNICNVQYDKDNVVVPNVFAGGRPSGIDNMSEFLVISLSRAIGEHNVYQAASCYIDIRVRNLEHGLENVARLQELMDLVEAKIPYVSPTGRFTLNEPRLVLSGDDGLEFSTWRVRTYLQINTTDRFSF